MKNELIAFVLPSHIPGAGGWGNGYVAIPKEHPCFEMNYDDINGIEVNGGLTFSDDGIRGQPEETKGMWIVGFDTLHSWDNMGRWPDEASVMAEAEELRTQLLTYKPHQPIQEQSNSVNEPLHESLVRGATIGIMGFNEKGETVSGQMQEQSNVIEGLEDAAKKNAVIKNTDSDEEYYNPHGMAKYHSFIEGANWFEETHHLPMVEVFKELLEVAISLEQRMTRARDILYRPESEANWEMLNTRIDKPAIDRANKLLNQVNTK